MKRSRILIAEDHAIVAEGLRRILERTDFDVVGVTPDGRALLETAAQMEPDLIVTDISMPLLNGIDAARELHQQNPKWKIIILTMHTEVAYAVSALEAGASGYVLKSAVYEELLSALRSALKGRTYLSRSIAKAVRDYHEVRIDNGRNAIGELTHRQLEVLQQLAEGRQVKEIAASLSLSQKTVEFHKYRIMKLLGLHTVAQLTRYAAKRGMVE
jgi:DNA-binding NarL/FixJ family response regulator